MKYEEDGRHENKINNLNKLFGMISAFRPDVLTAYCLMY